MGKGCFSIISAVSIKHKILSCVLAFFVLISSTNLLNFEEYKKTIMKSVEVSTELVVSQLFNISALPVSAISKMFSGTPKITVKKECTPIQLSKETTTVEQQTDKANETVAPANETANNKGTDAKDNNVIKATIGYSMVVDISDMRKVIKSEGIKDLFVADKLLEINFSLCKKVISVMFIMMLLLAILLARKNVGNNNIINNNKIKYKRLTQLILSKLGYFCV